MTDHQTQSEHRPAHSRRTLANGSSLLAVLILLSMLPPTAGIVAVNALGDDSTSISIRDTSGVPRRETRTNRAQGRVHSISVPRAASPDLLHGSGLSLLAILEHHATGQVTLHDRRHSPRPTATVRDALLALPPPTA